MTALVAQQIRALGLVDPLLDAYKDSYGRSCGLGPASVDLTLDQSLELRPGGFYLASTQEWLQLPHNVIGLIANKSTIARLGIDAAKTTFVDPGFKGFLTLEISVPGHSKHFLAKGSAICQIVFWCTSEATAFPYSGRYQDQERGPQEAR